MLEGDMAPSLIVIAGPNGAGKSTAAPALLRDKLDVRRFVNADVIAQGLSAFDPDRAALAAGRIMLTWLQELADNRESFAFETTLASRTFAPWIANLVSTGYEFHLFYLWLPSADLACNRVAERVVLGGHGVPDETIRRRYSSGLANFFRLYQPLSTTWQVYDSSSSELTLVAAGEGVNTATVPNPGIWKGIAGDQK